MVQFCRAELSTIVRNCPIAPRRKDPPGLRKTSHIALRALPGLRRDTAMASERTKEIKRRRKRRKEVARARKKEAIAASRTKKK